MRPLTDIPGEIAVEGIQGSMSENSFVLYISTLEKCVEVSCPTDEEVILYVGVGTLRNGENISLTEDGRSTRVILPSGFLCDASSGRYTVRVLGIRESEMGFLTWKMDETPTYE